VGSLDRRDHLVAERVDSVEERADAVDAIAEARAGLGGVGKTGGQHARIVARPLHGIAKPTSTYVVALVVVLLACGCYRIYTSTAPHVGRTQDAQLDVGF
jgi:hypothetical protein